MVFQILFKDFPETTTGIRFLCNGTCICYLNLPFYAKALNSNQKIIINGNSFVRIVSRSFLSTSKNCKKNLDFYFCDFKTCYLLSRENVNLFLRRGIITSVF
jgi:hypothetical protein